MSNDDFALYIRRRAKELGINLTTVAKRTGISRQALYNLLDSTIVDPKCSFLIRLSGVLSVHPIELLQLIFGHQKVPVIGFGGGRNISLMPVALPVRWRDWMLYGLQLISPSRKSGIYTMPTIYPGITASWFVSMMR